MGQLNRLFGQYTTDLAPGIPDPSQAVKERILYRSAREKSLLPFKGFKGDSMDINKNDFTMPLGEGKPQIHGRDQTPKTKTGGDKDLNKKETRQISGIDQIDSIKKLKKIEKVKGIDSIEGMESLDKRAEERKEKEKGTGKEPDLMSLEGNQKEDDLMSLENSDNRNQEDDAEEEEKDAFSMSLDDLL
ncbi:MAG: hypothetical protein GY940_32780 [bacterium]|nr:hypothetical protein [bacterium]